ncbi:glycoside hydrolase family 47 protein [Xylariomycetidae sp. FL2044]|nr:glycoside hydrolase family 47 protein [Xylariomycetidae sp. FL2044]
MLRLRRYRYYVLFAAIVVFLFYQITKDSDQWDALSKTSSSSSPPLKSPPDNAINDPNLSFQDNELPQRPLENPDKQPNPVKIPDLKDNEAHDKVDIPKINVTPAAAEKAQVVAYDHDEAAKTTTAPLIDIPDKNVGQGAKGAVGAFADKENEAHADAATTTIHWKKLPEHFPVSEKDIISLPTGKPKEIPPIQYEFGKESVEVRDKRQDRLRRVKAEMKRAWSGYMKYAKGHDELSPVTKKFRDPFCGWAATLVDSLDTLWIMGMNEEFEEALKEVEKIDFTTSSTRSEIPVFETTIRYLGGLIAAYDVTGGNTGGHDILLQKALELAEILMGVFDTPNRMPSLYYNWNPEIAKQPKRAATGVSVAELGSLAMEFTRLAQITKEDRYYDAVARITDAFFDWQERGTSIPGIFPERVDATGCNRTAEALAASKKKLANQEGESTMGTGDGDLAALSEPEITTTKSSNSRLGAKKPSVGTPKTSVIEERAHLPGRESDYQEDQHHPGTPNEPNSESTKILVQGEEVHVKPPKSIAGAQDPALLDKSHKSRLESTEERTLPECIPQGLAPGGWGPEQYSMGGSQDSTYEYWPKQWLLLGGLEPKYKTLHLKTVEAVKKWLLYRPMLPDNRDVLFSAKINTAGDPINDARYDYEVTHLTCFIGGMFGLGGKIFDAPVDVEIGKKLTDGCVWAYEVTPSGIMPEGASVVPCKEVNNCAWNETMYNQWLDPLFATRDQQLEDWGKRQDEVREPKPVNTPPKSTYKGTVDKDEEDDEVDTAEEVEAMRKASFGKFDPKGKQTSELGSNINFGISKRAPPPKQDAAAVDIDEEINPKGSPKSSQTHDTSETSLKGAEQTSVLEDALNMDSFEDVKSSTGNSRLSQTPIQIDGTFEDPLRPLSHTEYVANRIKNEHIPPGFVDVGYRRYILRPEAIESVWYMWRITGDTYWQEKGWKMFNAIISQTQTEAGHSAIDNVLLLNSDKVNEMESFWTAETLKYFYLLYSDPNLISLDEWVLNTEAHPFKRPI